MSRVTRHAEDWAPDLVQFRRKALRTIRAQLRKASLSRSNDVEDIFQEACLTVIRVWREGGEINNLEAYLLQVCRNLASRYMRGSIQMERALKGEIRLPRQPLPDERLILLDALESISDRASLLIQLHDVQGLSPEEICEEMGLTPGAFRTALHRSRRELRDLLSKT